MSVDYSGKKTGDLIKNADKRSIPFIAVIGEDESGSQTLKIKELVSGEESSLPIGEVAAFLKNKNGVK